MRSAGSKREQRSGYGRLLSFAFVTVVLILGARASAVAAQSTQAPDAGATVFQQRCTACHTIGRGDLVGPDLQGVTQRRERDWLVRWISAPDKLLAEGDPIATQLLAQYNNVPMPNLGLSASEVDAVLAYLASPGAITSAGPALPAGDPVRGKGYFTGALRLQAGGPPCMACHSVAGIGALGGGQLGPDLTGAFAKYGGQAGLAAFLAGVPTATMNAVWAQRPLTPQEQADLVAFLQQAAVGERPGDAIGQLTMLAVGGMIIVIGLAQVIWRRRLRAVRRPLLSSAAARHR